MAVWWWTNHLWKAWTVASVPSWSWRGRIRTAWVGITRIFFYYRLDGCKHAHANNLVNIFIVYLRKGFNLHAVNGSPIYPSKQIQTGIWFLILQRALIPHSPGQGSIHLFLWHALLEGQSELTTHSGRHATYGSPYISSIHWHAAALFLCWQNAFDPQGVGLQGSTVSVTILGGSVMKYPFYINQRFSVDYAYVLFFCNMHWKDPQYSQDHTCRLGNG